MTKDQFSTLLESIQSAECQVREDGQKEYAHDESNVFANFDRVAASLQLDRKQVLLVYALKHWDGIVSYVGGHKSQREDVRGRIKDLRMYLALLWGMVEEDVNVAGICPKCNGPVYHRQGKPGEYDHNCTARLIREAD